MEFLQFCLDVRFTEYMRFSILKSSDNSRTVVGKYRSHISQNSQANNMFKKYHKICDEIYGKEGSLYLDFFLIFCFLNT